jgi:hypothetical protein
MPFLVPSRTNVVSVVEITQRRMSVEFVLEMDLLVLIVLAFHLEDIHTMFVESVEEMDLLAKIVLVFQTERKFTIDVVFVVETLALVVCTAHPSIRSRLSNSLNYKEILNVL